MSRSVSRTRPSHSAGHSGSTEYIETIVPDIVSREVPEIYEEMQHFLTPIELDAHEAEMASRKNLPWWRRPSKWWMVLSMPLAALVLSATIAPRVEIYQGLVCATHRPGSLQRNILPPSTMENHIPLFPIPFVPPNPSQIFSSGSLTNTTKPHGNLCAADPEVQAKTAKLQAILTTVMGLISCITTAWWGAFSDRYGRTRLMGIALFGLLFTDLNFIVVTFWFRKLPGGYWFFLLTSILEGLLGGLASSLAAFHSYQADTTTPANRNRIFSLTMGLFFIGMTAGPTLGSVVIKATGRTIVIFYIATAFHVFFTYSLTKAKMMVERELYKEVLATRAQERKSASFWKKVWLYVSVLFGWLGVIGDDWSLPLVVAAYGCVVVLIGLYPYKYQYASMEFDWTAQTFGYYLSLVSATRSITLIVLLPVLVRLFKSKPRRVQEGEEEPLLASSTNTSKTRLVEHYTPVFELVLCRISVLIEMLAYSCLIVIVEPSVFTIFSMIGSLSSGFSPSAQTVALHLHVVRTGSQTETGKLFGALSVVHALCSQIIGPSLFGLVFAKSVVAGFPRAIFVLYSSSLALAFVLLLFVRLRRPDELETPHAEDAEGSEPLHVAEETLVEVGNDLRKP
ncbi:MFS general substrate transporter [Flagelloscypha sp. PMI_526]|nr:MFS general substrate transporter [Flagelloscypha sp. PMI_526]